MSAIDPVSAPAAVIDVAPRSIAAGRAGADLGRRIGLRALRSVLGALVSLVVAIGAWQLVVKGIGLNPFVARGPLDVWRYLTGDGSAANRKIVFAATRTTIGDAAVGFVAGTTAAVGLSLVFAIRRGVERTLMPIAMALRSVPLVAMTPLIALVFGRGLLGVTVISGIVTFFPTLVNVSLALRSVPDTSVDLMRAYGASPGTTLTKVQLPSALPALFASARIAAPLAMVGALLAEFLATGKGLGYLMLQAVSTFEADQMWSGVAIVTVVSVLFYGVISALEQLVLARFAPERVGRAGG